MKQPLGVILAGGRSSRMGGDDKALLRLGGRSLIYRCMSRLAPQVAGLAISANGDLGRFSTFSVPVLPDSIGSFAGPLAGVLAGLDWAAAQGADHIVTVAADTPFFPEDLVPYLLMAGEKAGLALAVTPAPVESCAKSGGLNGVNRHPTFGLWPVDLREDLRSALQGGLRKVVLWSDRHGAGEALFPLEASFFNINTPDDLARAEAML